MKQVQKLKLSTAVGLLLFHVSLAYAAPAVFTISTKGEEMAFDK